MSSKKLKILIVSAWYPSKENPTEGSFVQEQVSMLKNLGHHVTVLHPYLLGTFLKTRQQKDLICEEYLEECRVIRVGVKPVLPGFRGLAYKKLLIKCKWAFKRFTIEISKFDVIHSHSMFMGGYIAMNIAKEYNKSFFHTEHTSGLIFKPEQYNASDVEIIRTVYSTSKKNLFVSAFALNATKKQFHLANLKNFEVVANVVALPFFSEPIKQVYSGTFRYIVINNLIPLKRTDLLIKSFHKVKKNYPNSILTIAGAGSELEELHALVHDLNLQDSVVFLPKLNRQEVRYQISQHHILVSASQIETFGLTVAEAQAMGKPVVVTDSGGVRDIVTEETGIICEGNENELAKALVAIQVNYGKYNPNLIRERTYNRFSESVIGFKLEKIYSQILKQNW